MVTRRFLISATALVAAAAATRAVQAIPAVQAVQALARGEGGADAFPLRRGEAEWRRALSPERYAVLRDGRAEPAFSSPLRGETRRGTYGCAGCGQDSFSSAAKLDDGSGWPAFWAPFFGAVSEAEDGAAAAFRAAVRCSRCGGHLGTLSRDAATPTGLRYRIDGLALAFTPADGRGGAST